MSLPSSTRFIFPTGSGPVPDRRIFETAKYNSSINYLLNGLNSLDGELYGSQRYMQFSSPPVLASATTITFPSILCRNSTNLYWIVSSSSITVDMNAVISGGSADNKVLQSSNNLTGTISVSGTAVTGTSTLFTSELIVGDIIYVNSSNASRVTAITDNTNATIEKTITATNATYKRGGNIGSLTSAGTAGYYFYAISNGTNTYVVAGTRDVSSGDTIVDLPSGYSRYRQLPFYIVVTGAGTNQIMPFKINGGWPFNTRVQYYAADGVTFGGVSGSTSTGDQTLSLRPAIPKFARTAICKLRAYHASGTASITLTAAGSYPTFTTSYEYPTTNQISVMRDLPVNDSGQLIYNNAGTTPNTSIWPKGYVIDRWM